MSLQVSIEQQWLCSYHIALHPYENMTQISASVLVLKFSLRVFCESSLPGSHSYSQNYGKKTERQNKYQTYFASFYEKW